jgi:hypothetical protein
MEDLKEKRKKWDKTYRDKHRDRVLLSSQNFRDRNKEKERERSKVKYWKYRRENPEIFKKWYQGYKDKPEAKYKGYKNNARARGIEFGITFDEFLKFWQKPCSYCGSEIKFIGIDRIDNKKGYVKGNMKSCCEWCNKMKMNHREKEFLDRCKKIVDYSDY